MRRTVIVILALTTLSVPGSAAHAQSAPTLTRLGYAGLGAGLGATLGAMAGAGEPCGGFVCIPTAAVFGLFLGGGAGLIVGNEIASSAQGARVEGRPLSDTGTAGLTLGSALGGAVLGAVASAILIKPEGSGTFLGSDERTFGLLTAAGTVLGTYKAIRFRQGMVPRRVELRPGLMPDGQAGLVARLRF